VVAFREQCLSLAGHRKLRGCNLRELRLLATDPHEVQEQPLADLAPLAALTHLEVLELAGTDVADLGRWPR
jgi:hypothetical protein